MSEGGSVQDSTSRRLDRHVAMHTVTWTLGASSLESRLSKSLCPLSVL